MNPEDKKLLDKYQPLLTSVVFKFSNNYQNKRDLYFYCRDVNLHHKGINTSDLYQFGEIILINVLSEIRNKNIKIENLGAYLFTAVYRQLRYLISKQDKFTEFDLFCEKRQESQGLYEVETKYDHKELKTILYSIIEQLDDKKKYILESLYGLNGKKIKSQAQIGREIGVSYQWIGSIHNRSIKKIRKNKELLSRLRSFLD
ncbi:unnamed protein product [marine sediment metagenome]|uniref:RNA polymerase sigma-70 region 4 domain-containing protein n=1 Tax=marine sediment metagenome TaxID=412755 RepID=X0TDK8_9ZZZZ